VACQLLIYEMVIFGSICDINIKHYKTATCIVMDMFQKSCIDSFVFVFLCFVILRMCCIILHGGMDQVGLNPNP